MQDNLKKTLLIGGSFLVGVASLYLLTKRLKKKSNKLNAKQNKTEQSPEKKIEDLSIFSTPEKKEISEFEISDEKLEELFQLACAQVSSISEISDKQKLKLYGKKIKKNRLFVFFIKLSNKRI